MHISKIIYKFALSNLNKMIMKINKTLKQIQEFVGVGGLVPFEHGFVSGLYHNGKRVWGVSYDEIHYIGGKENLKNLPQSELVSIYNKLQEYLVYCQTEA